MGMRKMKSSGADGIARHWFPLPLLAVAHLSGVLLGIGCIKLLGPSEGLCTYLGDYLASVAGSEDVVVSLGSVVWAVVRWVIPLMAGGLFPIGLITVPLVLAVHGFFLSCAIAAMLMAFQRAGIWLCVVTFGVQTLLIFPALLMIGVESFSSAVERTSLGKPFEKERNGLGVSFALLPSVGLLLLGIALQYTVMPGLLRAVSQRLL